MPGSPDRTSFTPGRANVSPSDTQGGSRVPELGPLGSVRGALSNGRPYRELELGLSPSDVQAMTEHLRCGLVAKAPAARLAGEVEVDEVYVVAGHKGQPAAVAKKGGSDAVAGWPARRAGARWRRTSHPSSA